MFPTLPFGTETRIRTRETGKGYEETSYEAFLDGKWIVLRIQANISGVPTPDFTYSVGYELHKDDIYSHKEDPEPMIRIDLKPRADCNNHNIRTTTTQEALDALSDLVAYIEKQNVLDIKYVNFEDNSHTPHTNEDD